MDLHATRRKRTSYLCAEAKSAIIIRKFKWGDIALNGLLGIDTLLRYLLRAAVMLITIPFHESAHALVSWKLGDPTAKNAGRLSMNPARHFDPLGALCMVIGGVGWAKPVGINPRNFKNPKHGMAISAAAGPISNLLLAYVCTVLYKTLVYATWGRLPELLAAFLWYMISMNISLAVFNLIPVPPFDGSRIVLLFLPEKYYFRIMRYERYIMAAVLALVLFGALDRPLSFLVNLVWGAMNGLTGFVELAFGF